MYFVTGRKIVKEEETPTQRKRDLAVPVKKELLVTSQPTYMDDLTVTNLLLELGNVNIHHVCVEEAMPTSTVTTEGPVTSVLATSDKESQAISSIYQSNFCLTL